MTLDDLQRRKQLLTRLEAKLLIASKPADAERANRIEQRVLQVLDDHAE